MRRKLAVLAIIVAGVVASVAASPSATASPAQLVKICGAGYVHALLPWGEKCLRAGEFCKVRNAGYLRYGFVCPSTGHLRRR
jgi:hypothetical protein